MRIIRKALTLAAAALPLMLLSSCGVHDFIYEASRSDDIEIDPEKAGSFFTDIDVGDIDISRSEDEMAHVHIDIKIKGISKERADEALDHVSCSTAVNDGKLSVTLVDPETGKSYSDWRKQNIAAVDIQTNVKITLPDGFSDFEVKSDVGNINMDSMTGKFKVSADVGNVELTDIGVLEDSDFRADVGNVKLKLGEIGECSSDITVNVGDVELDTGDYETETTENNSDNKVGGKMTVKVADKCTFDLRSDVGSVSADKEE